MLTIATSIRIHTQSSPILAGDMCHALSGDPGSIPYDCAISTPSFLPIFLCTPTLLFVWMYACTYACMMLYMLDVLFSRVDRSSSSTLANSMLWLPH